MAYRSKRYFEEEAIVEEVFPDKYGHVRINEDSSFTAWRKKIMFTREWHLNIAWPAWIFIK
jgi:hypothetical protein